MLTLRVAGLVLQDSTAAMGSKVLLYAVVARSYCSNRVARYYSVSSKVQQGPVARHRQQGRLANGLSDVGGLDEEILAIPPSPCDLFSNFPASFTDLRVCFNTSKQKFI